MFQVRQLSSDDAVVRDTAVDAIVAERAALIQSVVKMLEAPPKAGGDGDSRAAAAYLLGELRAEEAAPVLAKMLGEHLGPVMRLNEQDRYFAPVTTALRKIGRPAVPPLLENIKQSDNALLRTQSMSVLYLVLGGKRRLLETLGRVRQRGLDASAARRVDDAASWARDHFKEEQEPLY